MSVTNPPRIEILDEGVSQGRVTRVDFTGAGVVASVAGELATVTISGGGGGGGSATRVVVTAAFPAKPNQVINVVDASVSATSKVLAWVSGLADGLANAGDLVDVYNMRAVAKIGSFDLNIDFLTPWAGSLSIDYTVFA
jgi:hypothetical protein